MIENARKESVAEIKIKTDEQREEMKELIDGLLSEADTLTLTRTYYLLVGFIYG